MGFWDVGILGGDTPYDFVDSIYEICGISQFNTGDNSPGRNLILPGTYTNKLKEIEELEQELRDVYKLLIYLLLIF